METKTNLPADYDQASGVAQTANYQDNTENHSKERLVAFSNKGRIFTLIVSPSREEKLAWYAAKGIDTNQIISYK